jgi:hypothetical protein
MDFPINILDIWCFFFIPTLTNLFLNPSWSWCLPFNAGSLWELKLFGMRHVQRKSLTDGSDRREMNHSCHGSVIYSRLHHQICSETWLKIFLNHQTDSFWMTKASFLEWSDHLHFRISEVADVEMSQSSKPLAEERCSGDYYDMDYSQKWKIRSHILILIVRYVVRYGVDNLHNIT